MPYIGDSSTYIPCWKMEKPDAWSFDTTLALFIADGLDLLIEMGNSHPADRTHDEWTHQLKTASAAFRNYGGPGGDIGLPDPEMRAAVRWLSDNFFHLWD